MIASRELAERRGTAASLVPRQCSWSAHAPHTLSRPCLRPARKPFVRLSALRLLLLRDAVEGLSYMAWHISQAKTRRESGKNIHLSPRAGRSQDRSDEDGGLSESSALVRAQRRGPLVPTFSPRAGKRRRNVCVSVFERSRHEGEAQCSATNDAGQAQLSRPADAGTVA